MSHNYQMCIVYLLVISLPDMIFGVKGIQYSSSSPNICVQGGTRLNILQKPPFHTMIPHWDHNIRAYTCFCS